MQAFEHIVSLTAPLFVMIMLGYVLARWVKWPKAVSDALTRFVFSVAIPALLFGLMSKLSNLPQVDARLLIAYFGGCLIVYVCARLIAYQFFHMDGVSQSVFALGGIFANNVLLGVPLAKVTLGEASIPSISMVLIFNALTLWTLVTVSVEWARHRTMLAVGYVKMARSVLTTPVITAILIGTVWGLTGLQLPQVVNRSVDLVAQAAVPLALIALGMSLAEYGIREGLNVSTAMCSLKLIMHPLVVLLLARWLKLPPLETQSTVMLASLPVGAHVYLMSRQFETLGGLVTASLVLSTALAAATTPLLLAFIVPPLP